MFMTTKMISQSVFFLRFVIVPNWTVWLIFGFMFLFSSCTKKPLGTFFYCEVGWPDESYNPMKEAFSQTFYCQFYHFGFPEGFFLTSICFKKLVIKIGSLVWLTKKVIYKMFCSLTKRVVLVFIRPYCENKWFDFCIKCKLRAK